MKGRTRWRRAVGAGAVAGVVLFSLTPLGCYLSRAGWEEAKILRGRKPIGELVRNSTVDPVTRGKLALVLDAREFAADSVKLDAGESFTKFTQLERDTLVLVLAAAYRDKLERYTWWFPIVGRVPYKGFFDFAAARRAAADLERKGFDVTLRPSSAFSTLGWFNDPLLSTTLGADSVDLVNTVIHELTHNTFYAPGQAVFNESFANFVGARGATWFFASRGDTLSAAASDARWEDEKILGAFYDTLYHTLDSAFKANPASVEARLGARNSIYTAARAALIRDVAGKLKTIPLRAVERIRLDNATLLARRIYLTDLELFDAVYEGENRDVRRAIARIITIAKTSPKDPSAGLRAWVKQEPGSRNQEQGGI
ncbi:MAG: aminopeptidase [Anaerolineae bacterium]|nr:aminopeptidase [Gemmatimonadaceae bacterium]